jgi:E3 ubiquitin-protein ligase synoviolin
MEDPERLPAEDEEAERRRRAEEAMEQMLLAQEQQADALQNDDGQMIPNEDNFEDEQPPLFEDEEPEAAPNVLQQHFDTNHHKPSFSYIQTSFFAALCLLYYALRSRQQWYLALVYLSSSKWAYIVLGNALVASLIWTFQVFTSVFMNGLRLAEAEGLGDFFRWNITETCLALTMFRSELNVQTGILFLILVLAKCLHWVADMREGHLRMTEEAIVIHPNTQWPAIRWPHFQLLLCLGLLQLLDILAVVQCGQDILLNGPSVSILFAFEGAILLVSVISNILLWHLHVLDGLLHSLHETSEPSSRVHRWIHPWKDHKATLVFAVEVQAQAAKFLFYVTFFAIVMTYYGMPINLFREVYLSFQSLKQRLVAFGKYRQLMANMNRFASPTQEEIDEDSSCIICRDEMTVETTKRLPGCGHLFHKSCLREWLVQQQSCPTCRGDIAAMEARQRQADNVAERARQRQEEQEETNANAAAAEEEESKREDAVLQQQQQQQQPPRQEPQPPPRRRSIMKDTTTASLSLENPKPRAIREKRVRIMPPPPSQEEKPTTRFAQEEEYVFPAFYRVVQDQGASVYNNGEAVSFVIRAVPFGLILLGRELAWRDCEGEKRLMLRMPDGWVCEDDVERIVAVPLGERNE